MLIRARPLDVVNHSDFDWTLCRFESQAKLLLKRRWQLGCGFRHGSALSCGLRSRNHSARREFQGEVIHACKAGLVDHWNTYQACKRGQQALDRKV